MPAHSVTDTMGILSLIMNAGPVVKLVLLILFLLSAACWGIIIYKHLTIRKAMRESEDFLDIFWETKRLDNISAAVREHEGSSAARVFRAGYMELLKSTRDRDSKEAAFSARNIDMIERALRRAENEETSSLEQHLNFLATTGSAAPFIGLFGTVWGIMNSFQRIGAMGSANLAVVAPGVSEALIATALGLAAAIPAVIFYNIFVARVRTLSQEIESMILEFLNIAERALGKRQGEDD